MVIWHLKQGALCEEITPNSKACRRIRLIFVSLSVGEISDIDSTITLWSLFGQINDADR